MTDAPINKNDENEMDTVLKRALHYVECYALHWPDSGASDVAEELRQEIQNFDKACTLSSTATPLGSGCDSDSVIYAG